MVAEQAGGWPPLPKQVRAQRDPKSGGRTQRGTAPRRSALPGMGGAAAPSRIANRVASLERARAGDWCSPHPTFPGGVTPRDGFRLRAGHTQPSQCHHAVGTTGTCLGAPKHPQTPQRSRRPPQHSSVRTQGAQPLSPL